MSIYLNQVPGELVLFCYAVNDKDPYDVRSYDFFETPFREYSDQFSQY